MNTIEKIKRSWWVILSFILFLNGFGFIYIGTKHNNRNWILEGVIYELPWFLYFLLYAWFGKPIGLNSSGAILFVAVLLMFIGIIRSVWVAVKLGDVYDNEEKYTIQSTVLTKQSQSKSDKDPNSKFACCLCIVVIFIIFMLIAL